MRALEDVKALVLDKDDFTRIVLANPALALHMMTALSARIRNTDGTDYPSARSVPSVVDAVGHGVLGLFRPNNRFTRRYRQLDADPAAPRPVDWLSGAAMWQRRTALDDVVAR